MARYRFDAIGTKWDVEFDLEGSADGDALMERMHERIAAFDKHYSRFRADSLVSEMAARAGTFEMPDDAQPMLDLYFDLNRKTLGAFTPLIGQALSDAGYDADYSLVERAMHAPPPLRSVISYEHPALMLAQPLLLDFGAAGKGYLVDIVALMLKDAGAIRAVVDAGGDIASFGSEIKIALEDPADASQAIGTAHIQNQSICGSAGNRRAWGRFTHILDPRTLESPEGIKAVWVVAETAMLADALTTCLYFVPPATLLRDYRFEYLVLRPDGSVEASPRFPAELFAR
ncbi:MAG TPA: FAD:protein FMN transferase [Candidatus Paceibacterota bacterium]|nr:FAD:protein FMN transferase [Candidatus Paceibacterota bacterium]